MIAIWLTPSLWPWSTKPPTFRLSRKGWHFCWRQPFLHLSFFIPSLFFDISSPEGCQPGFPRDNCNLIRLGVFFPSVPIIMLVSAPTKLGYFSFFFIDHVGTLRLNQSAFGVLSPFSFLPGYLRVLLLVRIIHSHPIEAKWTFCCGSLFFFLPHLSSSKFLFFFWLFPPSSRTILLLTSLSSTLEDPL